jgi:hypothetical protein
MLLRNTVIGVAFGLMGAVCVQYLCAAPARRKEKTKTKKERMRTKDKRERRRRRERQREAPGSGGEDDSDDEQHMEQQGRTKTQLRLVKRAERTQPVSPVRLGTSSSSSGEERATPIKGRESHTLRGLSPGTLLRKRTLLEHVLREKEAEYGKEHPQTLLSKWSLADLHQSQYGDLEKACALVKECVAVAKRNPGMGPEHKDSQRYETSLREWETLRRKAEAGQVVFNGPWSPSKDLGDECWVPATEW